MTGNEKYDAMYDYRCGIVRDEAGRAQAIEPVDYWWNRNVRESMHIYRLGDHLCCAYGWNGEEFTESFRVIDRFTAADDEQFSMRPIHRFEAEDRDPDEDNDDDFEIVGFEIF